VVEHVVGPEQTEAGRAACVQHERWQPEAGRRRLRSGERGTDDQARQPRPFVLLLLGQERREHVANAAGRLHGGVECEDLGDAVAGHVGRDGVRHLDEGEPRVPRRVRRVEGRVEDGYGEPARVERAGELQHRADVALERQREQRDAGGSSTPHVVGFASNGHSCRPAARFLPSRMMLLSLILTVINS
jgi:hypothetical protein